MAVALKLRLLSNRGHFTLGNPRALGVQAAPSRACFTLHLTCLAVGDSVQSSSARLSNLFISHRSSTIFGAYWYPNHWRVAALDLI